MCEKKLFKEKVGNRICKKCGHICKVTNKGGELVGFMCECDFSNVTIDWAVEEDLSKCNNYYHPTLLDKILGKILEPLAIIYLEIAELCIFPSNKNNKK